MRLLAAPVLLATALLHTPALAQGAAAEALYEQGKAAMAAGDYETACARFRASDQLDPGGGVRASLGACEEKRGKVASAWEAFKAALKKLPPDDARVAKIQARIDALEPRLPHLKITLGPNAPKETTVTEGDTTVGSAATFAIALPYDPGPHKLRVSAPGVPSKTIDITLTEGKETALVVDPTVGRSPAADGGDDSSPSPGPWVVGGIGLAALIAGAVTGGLVVVADNTFKSTCNPATRTCTSADGTAAVDRVKTLGPTTTVLLAVGGASVAAGAIWLGVRPSAKSSARIGVGPVIGGAAWRVEGSW